MRHRLLRSSLSHGALADAAAAAEDAAAPDLFYSEQHECVSVVFIDLVNFTPLAESQDSLVTMQMLHLLFSRYDDLAEALGVYKMESVGDCYMAAAGLLSPSAAGSARRHAAAATLFALRAHAAAAACGLRVRAGVHSGPCSSGLIGRLRARFCLFGGASFGFCFRFLSQATRLALACFADHRRLCLCARRHGEHGVPA